MTTAVCFPECQDYIYNWDCVEEPILSLQCHEEFSDTTHTSLQVFNAAPESPLPDNIDVRVFDPSKNINIPFNLKSTDTVGTLIKKCKQMRPELVGSRRLAYNGKHVSLQKTMEDLGVKPGAVFITFQRCTGG